MSSLYIIDDHPLVCEGLSLILQRAGHAVEGSAASIAAALADPAMDKAQLVILDLSLGDMEDNSQYRLVAATGKRILVYSMHEQRKWIDLAFAVGASGYVAKREPPECLLTGIRQVLDGNRYLSPRAAAGLVAEDPAKNGEPDWTKLTERELETVWALSQGEATEETAGRLFISPRTIEAYHSRVIAKLHLGGMKDLRRRAIQAAIAQQLPSRPTAPRPGIP